jgi:hypothetical protein
MALYVRVKAVSTANVQVLLDLATYTGPNGTGTYHGNVTAQGIPAGGTLNGGPWSVVATDQSLVGACHTASGNANGTIKQTWWMGPSAADCNTYVADVTLVPGGVAPLSYYGAQYVNLVPGVPPGVCANGTRLKAGAAFVSQLTTNFMLTKVLPVPLKPFAFVFDALLGQWIDVNALCGTGPPPWVEINAQTLFLPSTQLELVLAPYVWDAFCECVPGSLPSTDPTKPPTTTGPNMPVIEPVVCSNADICAMLQLLTTDVRNVQSQIRAARELVTLVQRYRVPFAYVKGAVHANLTGAGSFAIPRLAGVQVDVVGAPPSKVLEGTPPYLWDVGWMTINTADGMIEERRITRDTQVWQPALIQEATSFGYYFKGSASATVTELKAEPA